MFKGSADSSQFRGGDASPRRRPGLKAASGDRSPRTGHPRHPLLIRRLVIFAIAVSFSGRRAVVGRMRRAVFVRGELAVPIFVQCQQFRRSIGDFLGVNNTVAINVQRGNERRARGRWPSGPGGGALAPPPGRGGRYSSRVNWPSPFLSRVFKAAGALAISAASIIPSPFVSRVLIRIESGCGRCLPGGGASAGRGRCLGPVGSPGGCARTDHADNARLSARIIDDFFMFVFFRLLLLAAAAAGPFGLAPNVRLFIHHQ